tara:strand:+ start:569 stop:3148 length:2580 start_codon:yes stop_codon:yes gene_type:complete
MIRILFLKCFFFSLSFFSLCLSQIVIKKDTNWSKDLVLRESIVIDDGATLTIQPGTTISIDYVDADTNDIGDVSIKVLGVLNVNGSINSPVVFKPLRNNNKKTHWQGISFLNKSAPSKINFLELYHVYIGLDIHSEIKVEGLTINKSEKHGVFINSTANDFINLRNININHSKETGIYLEKGNVSVNWCVISKCDGNGLIINKEGVMNLKNFNIADNKDNGLSNYGTLTMYNGIINKNRHGVLSPSGMLVFTNGEISHNRVNGLLIGGNTQVVMENISIDSNGGYGIETTDWSQASFNSKWKNNQNDPSVKINKSNIINNYRSVVLDEYRYNNIWDNWDNVEYSGNGWVEHWKESQKREIPFGVLAWIGFNYNSNDGGSSFSWQPCTGQSIYSSIFDITNSRGLALTYLPAPFQCSWNPLAGQNSNKWNQYGQYTGVIDSSNSYKDWTIKKGRIPATKVYNLNQYFYNAYFPGDDSGFVVKPSIKDFVLSFYHGGSEISSYSDNNYIDIDFNHWGSNIPEHAFINQYGNHMFLNINNKKDKYIEDANSSLKKDKTISIFNPVKNLNYQDIKYYDISWSSSGWIPLIDIHLSVDNGKTWEVIDKGLINDGKYEWWNNLIVGEKFYLKLSDSNEPSINSVVGPCNVIENTTPILSTDKDHLNFITGIDQLQFSIKNNGGGVLEWHLEPNANWLVVDRYSGSAKKRSICNVSIKRIGLITGDYDAKIAIKSNGGDKDLNVKMIVAAPTLYVDTKYLGFDSTRSSHSFNLKNYGGGNLLWNIQSDQDWVIVSPPKGSTRTGASIKINLDRSMLNSGLNETFLNIKTNAGTKIIKVSAYGTANIPDTLKTDFTPWHWMYDYSVY